MSGTPRQLELIFAEKTSPAAHGLQSRALEQLEFPFEQLSKIAELESWRKEINRPIYHLHKWWAQRLGSVFRGILIGCVEQDPVNVMSAFYAPKRYPDVVVYDPFMGSGTTIGEALKLGMRGIGRDVNHVAYFSVRNAFSRQSLSQIESTFTAIEQAVSSRMRHYYHTRLENGEDAEVLYYFWVKVIHCPTCDHVVDLFSSYVFSRNAYPSRKPEAQILCPSCGEIIRGRYDSREITCSNCELHFDAQAGPASGAKAHCPSCASSFPIIEAVRSRQFPPEHRLYAKLLLLPNGTKAYQRATAYDLALFNEAVKDLSHQDNPYPLTAIEPGYNTNQVLNYQYRYWHQMFNARQLLNLSLLAGEIRKIDDLNLRELFTCLFSGVLEFNNMFATFKGEGTGAVRHMFAHHILKPERTPIEANVWGTPKSSGAFSTLFHSRLLRALDYRDRPFELRPVEVEGTKTSIKVYGLSASMSREIAETYSDFRERLDSVYLSCGDSANTDIATESVDLIVTDPPFFDNVHYSELADFFYVWQRHLLRDLDPELPSTTRSKREVQSREASAFVARLSQVFTECRRILRPDGLFVFTYHHSRPEGWYSLRDALVEGGFVITATHPIRSEMSTATPKSQARHPINLDVIIVCRRADTYVSGATSFSEAKAEGLQLAQDQISRLCREGYSLSRNDVRVIVMAQLLRVISQQMCAGGRTDNDDSLEVEAEAAIDELYGHQVTDKGKAKTS